MSRPWCFPPGLRKLLLRFGTVSILMNLKTFVCPFRRQPGICFLLKRLWYCSNKLGPFSPGNSLSTSTRQLRIVCIVVRLIPVSTACVIARAPPLGGRCFRLWCGSGKSCRSSRPLSGCSPSRKGGVIGRPGWTPSPCLISKGATLPTFRFSTLMALACSPGTRSFGLLRGLPSGPSQMGRFRSFGMVYSPGLVRLSLGRSFWRCRAPWAPLERPWSLPTHCLFVALPPGFCCSLRKVFHRCCRPITKTCGLTSSRLSVGWTSKMCRCGGSKGMSTIALLLECLRSTRGLTTGLTLLPSSLWVATSPLFSSTLWRIFVTNSLRLRTCSLSRLEWRYFLQMTGTPRLCGNRSVSGLSA